MRRSGRACVVFERRRDGAADDEPKIKTSHKASANIVLGGKYEFKVILYRGNVRHSLPGTWAFAEHGILDRATEG